MKLLLYELLKYELVKVLDRNALLGPIKGFEVRKENRRALICFNKALIKNMREVY